MPPQLENNQALPSGLSAPKCRFSPRFFLLFFQRNSRYNFGVLRSSCLGVGKSKDQVFRTYQDFSFFFLPTKLAADTSLVHMAAAQLSPWIFGLPGKQTL
jgi:hypothetical protein